FRGLTIRSLLKFLKLMNLMKIAITSLMMLVSSLCLALGGPPEKTLKIGRADTDITPARPVLVAGQCHARVSEGVMDSVTATVLAIESTQAGESVKTLMISCDLVGISDGTRSGANLRDGIREILNQSHPEISPDQVMINA